MIRVAALTTWLGALFTLPAVTRRVSPIVPRLIDYIGAATLIFVGCGLLFDGQKPVSNLAWLLIAAGFIAQAIASTWASLQVTPKA